MSASQKIAQVKKFRAQKEYRELLNSLESIRQTLSEYGMTEEEYKGLKLIEATMVKRIEFLKVEYIEASNTLNAA